MVRIKRKTRIVLCVLLACVIAVAGIVFEVRRENEQVWIDPSWNLSLPSSLHLVGRYEPNPPVFTETYRVTIASLENSTQSSFVANMSSGRNNDVEAESLRVIEETKIPDERRPDFQLKYYWKQVKKAGGCLEIIYFPNRKIIYITEDQ